MKICINCKWEKDLSCNCPKNMSINLVTGEEEVKWLYLCTDHRSGSFTDIIGCRIYGLCGKEGRWFEQKEKEIKNETN